MPLPSRAPRRLAVILAAPLLLAPVVSASPAQAVEGADSPVFINEIHYDNTGTDAGEAIEVAAPAGTDLTGWSIVLYNGSGGASYDTDPLTGTVPDSGNGWGFVTVNYPSNGIQNGAPDGVALVDGTDVVQFLSYEGEFTATNGPASTMTSTDIGVAEAGTEELGNSLQLTGGPGETAGAFTWAGPATASFGDANDGQTFGAGGSPVWINEIHYDNAGTDTGEAIEVAAPAGTDLTGWSLVLYNGNGGVVYDSDALPPTVTDSGNGWGFVTVNYPSNGIQNGSPDGVALVDGSDVVEFLSYEGVFAATNGPAAGMTSTDIGVEEVGTEATGMSLQLTGGPGETASDFTWTVPTSATFGAANTGQSFPGGDGVPVWVNEIHYDNAGADTGEAVEVVAPAGSNLSNWSLVLYNGNGGAQYATQTLPASVPDSGNGWGFIHLLTPGIQNGSPDGIALVQDATPVEFLSYEGTFTAADGPAAGMTSTDIGVAEAGTEAAGMSLQLTGGPGNDAGDFTWSGPISATFGAANTGQTFSAAPDPIEPPPTPECGEPTHVISQVQGSGSSSPLDGTSGVVVQAVVTADRTGAGGLGGFFIEEEAADRDDDAATSEGLFVAGSLPAGTVEGDVVQVTGTPDEAFGQTEIDPTEILKCDATATLPDPAVVTFPLTAVSDLERYEGMVATFPQDLVISEYFNYDRFGETVVGVPPEYEGMSQDDPNRFFTPTAVVEPGAAAQELAADYALRRITIDDGRNAQNPSPPYFPGTVDTPFNLENTFRGGDTLTDVTGVVGFGFSLYRVHPTADATYTSVNPRPENPPAVGGDVKVGSFNVLNYFLTLEGGTTAGTCGPTQNQDCRGANNEEERQRQRAKIVDAIAALDADVVGLMEMENTPGVEPAADLAAGLNDKLGAGTYDYIDTGVVGTDAIRVGYLYQPGSVRPVGNFEVLDSSDDERFRDNLNRPAIAQTWDEVGTGDRFTTAVNHLKSKGSDCNAVDDPDTGDGQGNCNETRTLAAQALADWLAGDPTRSGDPDRLIIGDLNSYDHEDPIDALLAAGYTDLVKEFNGEFAYGYVFDGQVGYLDHGLSSETLTPQVTGAGEWHINADEPDLIDYDTSFKGPNEDDLYEPNRYRSSDHDAVLIGLELDPVGPPACYADGAQSVDSFSQGQRSDGSSVPRPKSDPQAALGMPDGDSVTLGLGGVLTLEFSHPVQNNNGTAPDLRVFDERDGGKGRVDAARVEVSWDGATWRPVGTVTGTGAVDLSPASAVRFVRVVDTTPPGGPGATDGYDLDAVEVLTGCA